MTTQAFELQSVTDEEVLGATGGRNLRPLWPPARRAAAKPGVEGRRDREGQDPSFSRGGNQSKRVISSFRANLKYSRSSIQILSVVYKFVCNAFM